MSEVDAKGLDAILLSYISSVASYPRESNRVGLSVTTMEKRRAKEDGGMVKRATKQSR